MFHLPAQNGEGVAHYFNKERSSDQMSQASSRSRASRHERSQRATRTRQKTSKEEKTMAPAKETSKETQDAKAAAAATEESLKKEADIPMRHERHNNGVGHLGRRGICDESERNIDELHEDDQATVGVVSKACGSGKHNKESISGGRIDADQRSGKSKKRMQPSHIPLAGFVHLLRGDDKREKRRANHAWRTSRRTHSR